MIICVSTLTLTTIALMLCFNFLPKSKCSQMMDDLGQLDVSIHLGLL